ncbi:hypothetical protein [Catellatospora bangladeshensis]|uniref:Uncharacterized protein n=2 Tax=Catellatospora bangladeshensis TaxID=310355 RepID=A0A8J3JHC3_9ACTN|nr:hypothetical protein [Catellatospora bangladeshensis]GIF82619.1 hypothetical protein Cba03nite_39680 [Catellatospora bangladeshensis]
MSDVGEREALEPRTLLDHATMLHLAHPDGPLPGGGRPYPDEDHFAVLSRSGQPRVARWQQVIDIVTSIYEDEPSADRVCEVMADALTSLRAETRFAWLLAEAVVSFDPVWRRAVGRALAYRSRERGRVAVGLALLHGVAEPCDTAPVRMLGLLFRHFGETAIGVLQHIPGAAEDLVWLAQRSDPWRHAHAVTALCSVGDPATFGWLLREGVRPGGPSVTNALAIAETVGLAEVLDGDGISEDVVEHAGWLLVTMTPRGAGKAELSWYADAPAALSGFAAAADKMSATFDRYAMIVSLLADLHLGHAATLEWPSRELGRVRAALERLLDEPAWAAVLDAAERSAEPGICHRVRWATLVRTTCGQLPPMESAMNGEPSRIAIRVSVPDPGLSGVVETSILVDGRPIVAEAFTAGPAEQPEYLLGPDHRLRAGVEAHEVRLAVGDCEGCCCALYVTIERRGDEVIWRDWRNPDQSGLDLPTVRFGAAQYDAEITRAENDHSWEWPARTAARLLRARLREQPDLLGRWDCHADWLEARPNDLGRVQVSYFYPRRPASAEDVWVRFIADIEVPAGDPETVIDQIVRLLADDDPRRQQRYAGGSTAEAAEAFGFAWAVRR